MTIRFIPIILLSILLMGCNKSVITITADVKTELNNVESISLENRTPELPDIDPATISHSNNEFKIDMNGDGLEDRAIMGVNNVVYVTKATSSNTFDKVTPVLQIKGNIKAYTICILTNRNLPSILFWDLNNKGFIQNSVGTNNNGLPFFGEAERQ